MHPVGKHATQNIIDIKSHPFFFFLVNLSQIWSPSFKIFSFSGVIERSSMAKAISRNLKSNLFILVNRNWNFFFSFLFLSQFDYTKWLEFVPVKTEEFHVFTMIGKIMRLQLSREHCNVSTIVCIQETDCISKMCTRNRASEWVSLHSLAVNPVLPNNLQSERIKALVLYNSRSQHSIPRE